MAAGAHLGAPDSDEIDYIPKHTAAASPSPETRASRLPSVLTSLEIPPSYLEEILRSEKSVLKSPESIQQRQFDPQLHTYNRDYQHALPYNGQIYQQDHQHQGQYYEGKHHFEPNSQHQEDQRRNSMAKNFAGQYYKGQHVQHPHTQHQQYLDQKHQHQNMDSPVYGGALDGTNGAHTGGGPTRGLYTGGVYTRMFYTGGDSTFGVYSGAVPSDVVYSGRVNSGGVYTGGVKADGIYSGGEDTYGIMKPLGPHSQWSDESKQDYPGEVLQEVETTSLGPRFDRSLPRKVKVQAGKTAELACRVLDKAEKKVSWIRHGDLHILTVDEYKYSSDKRVSVRLEEERKEWVLIIDNVKEEDSGMYECQVSGKSVLSFIVSLEVVVPRAEVVHGPGIFVHRGSTINLTCVVTHGTQRPVYVYWYHYDKVLDYEGRGGVVVFTEASTNTVSHLLMRDARPEDSGVYSCRPSNGEDAYATLHVLDGEHRAAMQSEARTRGDAPWLVITLHLCLTSLIHLYMSKVEAAP
ncbi:uncharacterized protein [Procambarus clarkii]|uniref:uncharacterized protein n=1 Tax=Procambarus clarkii TaxID=6728 RepID=UPI001E6710BC|nr:uncharacterized protein LOC123761386 isoform X2 [Procambarus clarkii]